MAWDMYTIVARKRQKGANQRIEILSVTRNGEQYNMKPDFEGKPNFASEEGPPDEYKDCVYMGGAEKNRCRWVWGKWW